MYESHFGLTGPPFQLVPDPSFYFSSKGHSNALAFLKFGAHQGEGFIVVTGEIGAGKTTLVRTLLDGLDPASVAAAPVVSTQLEAGELPLAILIAFGAAQANDNKAQMLSRLEAFLTDLSSKGRRALLIVDEAQNLPVEVIEELRLLTNYQLGKNAMLQVFLVGQPELRTMLQSKALDQMRQRVTASCHLGPLDPAETRAYVEHRLRRVGWAERPKFELDAYQQLHRWTGGIPRRINRLCNRLLLYAFLEGKEAIAPDEVEQIAQDLRAEIGESDDTQAMSPSAVDAPQMAAVEAVPAKPPGAATIDSLPAAARVERPGELAPAPSSEAGASPAAAVPAAAAADAPEPAPAAARASGGPAPAAVSAVPPHAAKATAPAESTGKARPEGVAEARSPRTSVPAAETTHATAPAAALTTARMPMPTAPPTQPVEAAPIDLRPLADVPSRRFMPGLASTLSRLRERVMPRAPARAEPPPGVVASHEDSGDDGNAIAGVAPDSISGMRATPTTHPPFVDSNPSHEGAEVASQPGALQSVGEAQAQVAAAPAADAGASADRRELKVSEPLICLVDTVAEHVKARALARTFAEHPKLPPVITVYMGKSDRIGEGMDSVLPGSAQDVCLDVDARGGAAAAASVLLSFDAALKEHRPAAVLVMGASDSVLACSLLAHKSGVAVLRNDAGRRKPWAWAGEELNAVLLERFADISYITDLNTYYTLYRVGIQTDRVLCVGDLADNVVRYASEHTVQPDEVLRRAGVSTAPLKSQRGYSLATTQVQPRANARRHAESLVAKLCTVGKVVPVLWAIDTYTLGEVLDAGLDAKLSAANVVLIPSLGYIDCLDLLRRARCLVAGSTGECLDEAVSLSVPALVLGKDIVVPVRRTESMQPHVAQGVDKLERLVAEMVAVPVSRKPAPENWDGGTAAHIAGHLESWLPKQRKARARQVAVPSVKPLGSAAQLAHRA